MKWKVQEKENLVQFLRAELAQSGKSIRRLLEARQCLVNGRVERFGSKEVERGDWVEIAPNWKGVFGVKKWEEKILYEGERFKVVDKPSGWVCSEENARKFYGAFLVHRLDKETTGALLLAKREEAQKELMELFAKREVKKEYLALVDGVVAEDGGTRESFLARRRSYQGQVIWGSAHRGVRAITRWKVVARGKDATLVQCEPVTGRTHQIRVHLAEMGHPILGDRQYAAAFRCPLFVSRILLHALRLSWGDVSAFSPLPLDMREDLRRLQEPSSLKIFERI